MKFCDCSRRLPLAGTISDEDKTYVAQVVSRETGLTSEQAKQRVDTFVTKRNEAVMAACAG